MAPIVLEKRVDIVTSRLPESMTMQVKHWAEVYQISISEYVLIAIHEKLEREQS